MSHQQFGDDLGCGPFAISARYVDDWVAELRLRHQIHETRNIFERRRLDTTSFLVTRMFVEIAQGLLVLHVHDVTG
jgi:hypothetical protein